MINNQPDMDKKQNDKVNGSTHDMFSLSVSGWEINKISQEISGVSNNNSVFALNFIELCTVFISPFLC